MITSYHSVLHRRVLKRIFFQYLSVFFKFSSRKMSIPKRSVRRWFLQKQVINNITLTFYLCSRARRKVVQHSETCVPDCFWQNKEETKTINGSKALEEGFYQWHLWINERLLRSAANQNRTPPYPTLSRPRCPPYWEKLDPPTRYPTEF